MPELSIIVPVYKVEPYLPKCIDSILAQTFTDFELILIDDGSPDRCGQICDEYAAKDDRIIVIHQENKGVSAARNAGLDIANGSYIGFVDSDDWIEPEMYEELLSHCKSAAADVSVCAVRYYSERGELQRSDLCNVCNYDTESLLESLYGRPNPLGGGCCNKLFVHDKIESVRFDEKIHMAEDWVFLFNCFKQCKNACKFNSALYNVRERRDSATRLNEVSAYYDIVFGGKSALLLLLLLAREYSKTLEKIAIDKYMDDCLRYSNIIRDYARRTGVPYKKAFFQMRFQILKQMPRVIAKKLLPKEKIRGYLFSMVRK